MDSTGVSMSGSPGEFVLKLESGAVLRNVPSMIRLGDVILRLRLLVFPPLGVFLGLASCSSACHSLVSDCLA